MIRNNLIKYILVLVTLVSVTTSCEDYLDVNTDPNNPTSVTPELILPVGQYYTASYLHGSRRLNHLGNMLMYNWSESNGFSWYDTEFRYDVTVNFYDALFNNAYFQSLKQYQLLVNNEDPAYVKYKAIGKIMKSYHFQILVDLYGDVPYFDALQRSENATPKYDSGEEIYGDLLVQLDEAIDLIKSAPATAVDVKNDAMFSGDMTNWIRFANTLKVRIINRWKDVNEAIAVSTLADIEEEGSGFITADVVINPGFLNESDKQNPFYAAFGFGVDGTATQNYRATPATDYIIEYLTDTEDPRINRLYVAGSNGHLGVPQGIEAGTEYSPDLVSKIGPGLLKNSNQGSIILSLAEHNFNMAELALIVLNDPTVAEDYYYDGIQASFATLGASGIACYLGQFEGCESNIFTENVGFNAGGTDDANRLEAIITQKWIAVNGINAEQSWFDYSRTGYPAGLPISGEAKEPTRPVRLYYPASETSFNAGNVPSQPDAFDSPIFWAN